jgi:ferritin-like protein
MGMPDERDSMRCMAESTTPQTQDPEYREAVVDLLGVLTLAELTAFERLAEDAKMAPSMADKAALGAMAVAEFRHFEQLRDRLAALGVDADEAMTPFIEPLQAFHDRTVPADWMESLVKAYVGDGIAIDFYREVSAYLDPDTQALVRDVLSDTGHAQFAVERVRAAIEDDPRIAGRLALWGRRLVGEALSQAQRVAADRDSLAALIVGGVDRPGMALAALSRVLARLTENHSKRMAGRGLAPYPGSRVSEADAAFARLTDVDVGQVLGDDDDASPALVTELEDAGLPAQGILDCLAYLIRSLRTLQNQFARGVANADLDLHR